VDADLGPQLAQAGGDTARQPAATPWDQHRLDPCWKVLRQLTGDHAVARHDLGVQERVDEEAVLHPRVGPVDEGLPPAVEADRDGVGAEFGDALQFGGRGGGGHHHRAGHTEVACHPGGALGHVARRGREQARLGGLWRRGRDRR